MHYVIKTLGCKANLFDSEWLEGQLHAKGWARASEKTENESVKLCIINTCTVTDEADRQSRKMAIQISKEFPNAKTVVTGCAAEVNPEQFSSIKEVHAVIGNRDKPRFVEYVFEALENPTDLKLLGTTQGYAELLSRHPLDREWPALEGIDVDPLRTRSFLKIQEGCNSFCTFCIIPYGRGPSRSLEISVVVRQIAQLVANGVKEVVLTGTNLGDYGMDWSGSFQLTQLLEKIFRDTELERIRVSSLDPTEITPPLIALQRNEKRFCPHFHVSLQSPHSRILKLMKRKYGNKEVRDCLENLKSCFVGMDLIAGFPGESKEDFEWTVRELEALPWSRLHVFPYSERKGTPATKLPASVPPEERYRRSKVLRDLSLSRLKTHYEKMKLSLGLKKVLLEAPIKNVQSKTPSDKVWISGYSEEYLRFLFLINKTMSDQLVNHIVTAEVKEIWVDPKAQDVAFIGNFNHPT